MANQKPLFSRGFVLTQDCLFYLFRIREAGKIKFVLGAGSLDFQVAEIQQRSQNARNFHGNILDFVFLKLVGAIFEKTKLSGFNHSLIGYDQGI